VLLPIKNGRACAQPEAVTRGHLARGQQELLVQWRGQPAAEATWMDHQEFQRLYPDFQLEDELLAKGGGRDVMVDLSLCVETTRETDLRR
jgi:hypothetical protein